MSPSRTPIDPPALEGYRFLEVLGSGGFSDVFLYEREFPRQRVAIKVLVPDAVDDPGGRRFTAEANVMASLSTHPYIVSIYEARLSASGHPYLVMEYYPRPNFHARARTERFSVPAVLRAGINIAAAVETAHRNGVLHRDIKPANILTSEYGRPGLTDFGIAAADGGRDDEAEGMSIPWSPPEIVAGTGVGDARSDVYSLGATLWTLLSGGRSPFEVAGASNRSLDLIDRIERGGPPAVDRADVPDSLQRLLAQAMAKEPRGRPATAAELARSLQVIEVEQRFDMTPFEVREEEPEAPVSGEPIDADAGSTRVKGLNLIEAQQPERRRRPKPADDVFRPSGETVAATSVRPAGRPRVGPVAPSPDLIAATPYVATDPPPPVLGAPIPAAVTGVEAPSARHDAPSASRYDAPQPGAAGGTRRPPLPVLLGVAAAVLLVVVAVLGVVLLGGGDDGGGGAAGASSTTSPDAALPPPVEQVRVAPAGDGMVTVTWVPQDGVEPGDEFHLRGAVDRVEGSTATSYTFPSDSRQNCVVITVVRDGRSSEPATNPGC